MRVRFWGTRGSIPTPGPDTVRYGGNTSCVEVRTDGGELLVLDCGTGARALGVTLVEEAGATGVPPSGSVLIGHTHWDHIHGLPFFAPLFVPGSRWDVYGPRGIVRTLDAVLAGQMEYQYFPVGLDEVAAQVEYHDLVEGVFEIGDATIRTHYLNHPALTLAYRIEVGDAVLVYATDHEPYDVELADGGSPSEGGGDEKHAAFFADADLLIHDAQYDSASYGSKVGWGHSPMEYVVDLAASVGVRQLMLFHHDPGRGDDMVDDLLERARARAAESGLVVEAAAEGVELEVRAAGSGSHGHHEVPSATTAPALEHLDVGVVVASHDSAFTSAVETAALAEGLQLRTLEELGDHGNDSIVVLDVDDDALGEALPAGWSIIGVTRHAVPKVATHVSDWIVLPCSIAHLRTKLHAAVLRRACRWTAAPLPADEDHRLASLRALGILDTPPEARFDRYTEMARKATDTPVSLVTLVDADRQWFKSHAGFPIDESPRDESMCAHAILGDDVLVIPDTLADDRFADNPAVTGPARIRFYAGVPLVLRDGSHIGTLCVGDHRPRVLDEGQLDELRRLAALVVAELETSPD